MARPSKQRRASGKPGTRRHESARPLRRGRLLITLALPLIESTRASGLGPQAAEAASLILETPMDKEAHSEHEGREPPFPAAPWVGRGRTPSV